MGNLDLLLEQFLKQLQLIRGKVFFWLVDILQLEPLEGYIIFADNDFRRLNVASRIVCLC